MNIIKGKKLYWGLIITFFALYLAVAFVSTLHAITFFQLANTLGLAILLGAAYEIGQASVLFSILMTENKNRILAWLMMFLLTALQVTANVYASFKFMDTSGTTDWTFWQRSILFWLEADSPEMYKVIISWISGALLPLVALGMTALVADNIKLASEVESKESKESKEKKEEEEEKEEEDDAPLFRNPFKRKKPIEDRSSEIEFKDELSEDKEQLEIEKKPKETKKLITKKPLVRKRGWHLKREYIDSNGDVYNFGKFNPDKKEKPTDPPKKV